MMSDRIRLSDLHTVIIEISLASIFTVVAEELLFIFFFFKDTAPTDIYPLPLHAALPIWTRSGTIRIHCGAGVGCRRGAAARPPRFGDRHQCHAPRRARQRAGAAGSGGGRTEAGVQLRLQVGRAHRSTPGTLQSPYPDFAL